MSDAPCDLGAAAGELYGLPPADFTARRDELSTAARAAGDRDLAAQVKALRRPTVSAWLLNLAARAPVPELADLVDLGGRMRRAQADLDGAAMKELSQQRSGAEKAVLRAVQRLAREQKQDLTSAAATEVEQTLRAAVADPRAARAVVSGRLTRALSYAGFGEVDLDEATATPLDDGGPAVPDELAERRARKAAAGTTPAEGAPRKKAPAKGTPSKGAPKKGTSTKGTSKKGAAKKAAGKEAAKDGATREKAEREKAEREKTEREQAERRERAAKQERERAERLAALQAAVDEARAAAEAADRAADEAEDAERAADELVADLHRRLREARDAVTAASKHSAAADRDRSRARRALAQAERDLRKADPDDG